MVLMVGEKVSSLWHEFFGRECESGGDLRVEAVGVDWVVARDEDGFVYIATGRNIHELLKPKRD